jgi:exopolysaccharide biosynthesis polyprenyl glycosylphosphotransferase
MSAERSSRADGAGALLERGPSGVVEAGRAAGASEVAYRDRRYGLRRMLALGDAFALASAFAFATLIAGPSGDPQRLAYGLITIPLWWITFKLYGLYDRDTKRVSHSTLDDETRLYHSLVVGSHVLWVAWRAIDPGAKLILVEGATFIGVAFLAILATRQAVRAFAYGRTADRVLIVGGGPLSELLLRKINAHPEYSLEPVGYMRGSEELGDPPDGLRFLSELGDVGEIHEVCRNARCDRVLVVANETDHDKVIDLMRQLQTLRVPVSLVPDIVDTLGSSVEVDDLEGMTVLGINPPTLTRSSRALKRALDVSVAAVLLVLTAPLMALAALAVRLDSSGPAIYRQERIGRKGRSFRLYKFRTMVEDAAERADELWEQSAHPAWLLLESDPRVTRVGRFLRRTSIDELPQLWNTLRGDMSLVGPRPMTPEVYEHMSGWHLQRLDLTPGITGPWQVLGRTAIPFEEMLKLDYLYVTNWSLWQDVRLLIRTLPAIIRGRGGN